VCASVHLCYMEWVYGGEEKPSYNTLTRFWSTEYVPRAVRGLQRELNRQLEIGLVQWFFHAAMTDTRFGRRLVTFYQKLFEVPRPLFGKNQFLSTDLGSTLPDELWTVISDFLWYSDVIRDHYLSIPAWCVGVRLSGF
jgi:hypothetical protein